MKVAPSPSCDCTSMRPPSNLAFSIAIESPSPLPPEPGVRDDEVRVGSEGRRVVLHVAGRIDADFAQVLGGGLTAAVEDLRPVMIDVAHLDAEDVEVLRRSPA